MAVTTTSSSRVPEVDSLVAVCAWVSVVTELAAMTANAAALGRFDPIFRIRMSPRWLYFFGMPGHAQACCWQLAPPAINGQFHRKYSMQIDGKGMLKDLKRAPDRCAAAVTASYRGAGEGVPNPLHFRRLQMGVAPDE